MRPTRTDTTLAVGLALGLHLLLALGILFVPRLHAPPAKGAPIVAELIDTRALSPALRRALEPLPAPTLAPVEPGPLPMPEIEPPPRELPELAPVRDLAPEREAERLRQELAEAERLREEQAAEAERQRQAELERQRRIEAERRRRETEQQLERIRAERARAEREERQAQERVRELERRRSERTEPSAPPESPPPGAADGNANLRAQWIEAIRAQINREWIRPDSIRPGSICPIRIRMRAGGEVISAQIQPTCPYDDAARRSVEAAVLKASPLPWAGYETVAVRDFIVRFQPSSR